MFSILIVLIVRTSYCLFGHSFCCMYSTMCLLSLCRTIVSACISSALCTPWDTSSLIRCLRCSITLLYLLDYCCISHTHLANTMWVSPIYLCCSSPVGRHACCYHNNVTVTWLCNVCMESSSGWNRSLALCPTLTLAHSYNILSFHSAHSKRLWALAYH